MKFKDLDVVRLLVSVPIADDKPGVVIPAGAEGTVVSSYNSPKEAYTVEFGEYHTREDLALPIVFPDQLELVKAF